MAKQQKTEDKTYATKRKRPYATDLSAALIRADELKRRLAQNVGKPDDLVLELAAELSTTLEELQIADEELRTQNEELFIARERLNSEREKYADLFESAPDGYLVTDSTGTIIRANKSAAQLLVLSQKHLFNKPLLSFIATEDRQAFRQELDKIVNGNSTDKESLDYRFIPRDGKLFYASLRVSVTRNNQGRVTELRWILHDITDIREAAEEVTTLNAELEERVRERTAELEQVSAFKDELLLREQQARSEAEAANRSKDDFLAVVSHELRTPLNAILGWAQLIRQNVDSDQRIHASEVIERSARAQARLINDILDVSRVVSGGLPIEKRPLNIVKVIEAAVEEARPAIETKGIMLKVTLDSSVGAVIGDATRLQQVLGNLLSNSTKFTPKGGTIEVKLERAGEDCRTIVVDTGYGISPEFLPYVFERFRQADSQITRQQGGMGLGLAIVKALVELHGGTVEAESAGVGRGATFTITLPRVQVEAIPEKSKPDAQVVDPTTISERLAAMWVVVVDDDHDAREMMRAVLEGSGARVTTCGSYEEALGLFNGRSTAALTAKLPDVLVADIAMPGLDGFDLIRAVRRLEPSRGGDIPAIALTAYADEETRKRALKEGYQKHLSKPLVLEDLVTSIARVGEQGIIHPPQRHPWKYDAYPTKLKPG
ncbi:MAG TPA: ATP-binding protein [Blastocatellia bacterium]|nr:ATP-binding protein [Blastocatellia bacterium]